jgi:hypothetical protein
MFFNPIFQTEELSDAKERNVQLTARLQEREADLDEARRDLEILAQEKERLRERVIKAKNLFYKFACFDNHL